MYIKIKDINLAYDSYGEGKDIWIVMHGNRDKRQYMEPYALAIAEKENTKVYNLDLRGHGETDKPDYTYSIDMFVEDIEDFLDKMNIKEFSILGHSLGTTLAILLNKKNPDRIKKLVLISASAYFTPKFRPPNLKNYEQISVDEIHQKARYFMFSEKYPDVIDTVLGHWSSIPRSVHKCLLGVKHPDLREDVKLIKAPTLLIYGEKDLSTPLEDGKYIQTNILSSYLMTIPECSHFVILEEPEKVSSLVKAFV